MMKLFLSRHAIAGKAINAAVFHDAALLRQTEPAADLCKIRIDKRNKNCVDEHYQSVVVVSRNKAQKIMDNGHSDVVRIDAQVSRRSKRFSLTPRETVCSLLDRKLVNILPDSVYGYYKQNAFDEDDSL